jgi:PAS domain S-box-containing protein
MVALKPNRSVSAESPEDLPSDERGALASYGLGFLGIAAAILVRWLLDPWLENDLVVATMFGGIAVAVWIGGWRPAAVAALVGMIAAAFLFMPPRYSFAISSSFWAVLLSYAFSCVAVIWLGELMRLAHRREREHGWRLRLVRGQLLRALQGGRKVAWEWNLQTGQVERLGAVRQVIGFESGQIHEFLEHVHPEDRHRIAELSQRAARGEVVYDCEFRFVKPDGNTIWIHDAAALITGKHGKPYCLAGVLRDCTEERKAEEALRESEERFRTMADGLPLIVWVHDSRGNQQFVNRTFCEFFGVTQEDTKGERWQTLMHPDDAEGYKNEFVTCVRERRPFHAECRVRNGEGQWRCIESWGRPRFSLSGEFLGFVGTSADITERKGTEEALADAQEQLRKHAAKLEETVAERTAKLEGTIQDLKAFSYAAVHDMRAPLRAMHGYAELALDGCGEHISAQGRDYLRRICTSASRLDLLICDVLSYSEVTLRDFSMTAVDTGVLLTGILESYPNLQGPGISIELQHPLPTVRANAAALTQVFSNLLDNAVKFVAPGVKPRVRVHAQENGEMVRLWFEDNGIGMDPDAAQKLFRLFQRMVPAGAYEGRGIGLAIVEKAVTRMGGSVGVESGRGKGSRFWVELQSEGEGEGARGAVVGFGFLGKR